MFTKERIIENFLTLACLIFASYFTTIQFIRFSLNEDVSVLSYRQLKFDSQSKDQYPTYTICLYVPYVTIFKRDSYIWIPNLITPKKYLKFLNGGLSNDTSEDIMRKFSNVKFDEVVINPTDDNAILSFRRCNEATCMFVYMRKECDEKKVVCLNSIFVKTQQTPEEICYTRKFNNEEEYELATDTIAINGSKLIDIGMSLYIYVHQGDQLIRQLNTMNSPKVTEFYYWDLQKHLSYEVTHSIHNVAVLRSREKATVRCDESLLNEDEKWRNAVMKQTGCRPSYWESLPSTSSLNQNFTLCTPKQYEYLVGRIWRIQFKKHSKEFFNNITKLYTTPCSQMKSSVLIKNKESSSSSNDVKITLSFKYDDNHYLEMKNKQAYDGETLLSQVGGFIGN